MKNRNGEVVVSCAMTDDSVRCANCGTCAYYRGWWNTSSIHEPHPGEPDPCYCGDKTAVTLNG